jgi:hypothetical protein
MIPFILHLCSFIVCTQIFHANNEMLVFTIEYLVIVFILCNFKNYTYCITINKTKQFLLYHSIF